MSEINVLEQISLQSLHTFGLEIKARFFFEFCNVDQLEEGLIWARERKVDYFVLGGGSNVLFTTDPDRLVMCNRLLGKEIVKENESYVWIKSGGGEVWHELVMYCIDHGWGGIENMSFIPGSVGAAPMQNIGAYGVEIKDVFESLEALNVDTFEIEEFDAIACQFGYRESVFKRELKDKYIILSVTLKLAKKPKVNISYGAIKEILDSDHITHPGIREVSEAVIKIRQSKLPDPAEIGNSGSFFKNPVISYGLFDQLKLTYANIPSYPQSDGNVKVPAGWLIEQAGWKGKRRGTIGVHDKQALVLVNHGGGSGTEIYELAKDIVISVEEKFSIRLETEVNIY